MAPFCFLGGNKMNNLIVKQVDLFGDTIVAALCRNNGVDISKIIEKKAS